MSDKIFILTITSERFFRVRNAVSVGPSSSGGILRGLRGYLLLPLLLLGFHLLCANSVKLKIRVVRLRLYLGLRGGVVVFVDCLPLLGEREHDNSDLNYNWFYVNITLTTGFTTEICGLLAN